jgi:hypothetical protein
MIVAFIGLYCNWAYSPTVQNDANPAIIRITQIIYIVQELIYLWIYMFQIKLIYDFSESRQSKV